MITKDIELIDQKISKESAFIDDLFLEINKTIIGQKKMIERLLIGLLGSGHILLEGVPGLAKTLAINTLAKAIKGDFNREKMILCKKGIDIGNNEIGYFTEIIKRSVQIKADIVSVDEFEKGQDRIKLNYGHTIGHSLEGLTNYGKLLHGEAVSIGMVVAARISENLNLSTTDMTNNIINTLNLYGLPTKVPSNINIEELFQNTKNDKKVKNGKINWVLLKEIGNPIIKDDVPESIVI